MNIINCKREHKNFYFIQEYSTSTLVIYTKNYATFESIKQLLTLKEIRFYTHTYSTQKLKSLVLKGIREDFSDTEIKKELISLNIEHVEIMKVTKISLDTHDASKYLFLVRISNNSHTRRLIKVTHLAYQRIKWEPLRKKQVYQCQGIVQSSVNCGLPPRCVKSAQNHKSVDCDIPTNSEKLKLKCVNLNCGEIGHPASYAGCIVMRVAIAVKEKQKALKQTHNQAKISRIARNIQPNVNFA